MYDQATTAANFYIIVSIGPIRISIYVLSNVIF